MKSWIFVSNCLVGRISKEFPLSAVAIMASLFLTLVCMDLMVLIWVCVVFVLGVVVHYEGVYAVSLQFSVYCSIRG